MFTKTITRHFTKICIALCSFFLLPAVSMAQFVDEYSRFSISLQGGITLGYPADVNQVFGSNYNTFTQSTNNFGGEIQYSIYPFWTTGLGYRLNTIKGTGVDGFKTDVQSLVFRNMFNLNRIFRRHQTSEWLNPYIILGIEHDFFEYNLDNSQVSGNESAILGGLGVAARVHNRIELFSQYEVKFSNNKLDNLNQGYPFDQVGMVTGGIRIRLGKTKSKPLRLAPPVHFLSEAEYQDLLMRNEQLASANEDIIAQQNKIDELAAIISESNRRYTDKNEEQQAMLMLLEEKIKNLEEFESEINNGINNDQITDAYSTRINVEAGHYVQIYASSSLDPAVRVRGQIRSTLGDYVGQTEEMVFILKRKRYYEVLIGTFNQFHKASEFHKIVQNLFDDAFVITFPRPLHLKDAYEGTEIIWDNQSISSLNR